MTAAWLIESNWQKIILNGHVIQPQLFNFFKFYQMSEVTGYVYCPPGCDEYALLNGLEFESIRWIIFDQRKIANETFTDIYYIKEKNSILITGETNEEVYKAYFTINLVKMN